MNWFSLVSLMWEWNPITFLTRLHLLIYSVSLSNVLSLIIYFFYFVWFMTITHWRRPNDCVPYTFLRYTRKKVAVSFLTIPSKSDIKIFHMYVSTCQHVSLCEHKCPQVLSPPTHSVTLDKSLSLSWSQSPLLLKAVALIYYFHAYLEKYIPVYSIPWSSPGLLPKIRGDMLFWLTHPSLHSVPSFDELARRDSNYFPGCCITREIVIE